MHGLNDPFVWKNVFGRFLLRLKQDQALPSHVHKKMLPHSTQFGGRTIWHRTIWHRTIWHQDNLAPGQFGTGQFGTRTIWHQHNKNGQFGTGQFGTNMKTRGYIFIYNQMQSYYIILYYICTIAYIYIIYIMIYKHRYYIIIAHLATDMRTRV